MLVIFKRIFVSMLASYTAVAVGQNVKILRYGKEIVNAESRI